jgi:succinyl-diaminopimelate desuccinylase
MRKVRGGRDAQVVKAADAGAIDWCLAGEPSSEKSLGDTIKRSARQQADGSSFTGVQGHIAHPQFATIPFTPWRRLPS